MATLIKTDGIITEVFPENGKTFTLKELQKFVRGGYKLMKNIVLIAFVGVFMMLSCNSEYENMSLEEKKSRLYVLIKTLGKREVFCIKSSDMNMCMCRNYSDNSIDGVSSYQIVSCYYARQFYTVLDVKEK